MSVRIAVVGDVHGEIKKMYDLVSNWESRTGLTVDGIIQVGDFGVYPSGTDWQGYWEGSYKAPKPTLVNLGNHEDIVAVNKWLAEPNRVENIHLALDGRIVDFMGLRVASIWGNYSPVSYKNPDRVFENRTTCQSHRIAMHINRYSVETLLEADGPMDMLVTHDASPNCFPTALRRPMPDWIADELGLVKEEINHAQGCPGFDAILKKFKPKNWVFGHLHVRDSWKVGNTEVDCLQCIQYTKDGDCFKILEF